MIRSPYRAPLAVLATVSALVSSPSAAPKARVAVADFQGAGSVGDYDSLGAGLQSMLTTDLASAGSITVVERARLAEVRRELKLSRSAWADPSTALRVGQGAGASHLVTGTFTLVGDKLRLDARVIDVATGKVVVATNAAGERDAFFELEKNLAGAIVAGLGITLTPKERASLARIQTADWEAFRRFGDGLRLFDDADYDRALEALRQATARDQEFKLARTTLETCERLAREIRGHANLIEAEAAASSALARKQMRAEKQAIIERLVAVAGQKGARITRAAALYLVVKVLLDARNDEGLDQFARERMLDSFVARYVREADGLYPDMPIVPFEPMGERFGTPKAPTSPADVDRAVAAAADRFANYGLDPRKEAADIHKYKEEHLEALFSKELGPTIASLHLDPRGGLDLADRFFAVGARFSTSARWRGPALRARALRRRAVLDIDESTRLYKEAAGIETSPGDLRELARQVETNGRIAAVLAAGSADPCLREWAMAAVANNADAIDRDFASDSKRHDLCATETVQWPRRRIHEAELLGDLPMWILGPGRQALSTGPRSAAGHLLDLRYLARKGDRPSWMVALVGAAPHAAAELRFELGYELPADLPPQLCGRRNDCLAPGERPTVIVFFDATNIDVREPRRGNEPRDDVPLQAVGVALGPDGARPVDLRAIIESERMQAVGMSTKETGAPQPLPLPPSGKLAVTVRREERRLVVESGGRQVVFTAPPASGGFLGFAIDGHGFVRIASPRLQAKR